MKMAAPKGPPCVIVSAVDRQILPVIVQDDDAAAGSNFSATPFMQ